MNPALLLLMLWPFHPIPAWETCAAALAKFGTEVSGTLVDKVDLEEQREARVLNDCFASLMWTIGQNENSPTVGHLQEVQAMAAAVDREAEHESNANGDQTILRISRLLDEDAGEIVCLVPKQDSIQRVLDPERTRWRASLCRKRNAHWFRDQYNRAVKSDGRFAPLP